MTRRRDEQPRAGQAASGATTWDELTTVLSGRRQTRLGESEFRLEILNALMRTPHGNIAPYIEPFRFLHERDPLFFSRLAVWYFDNGTVHDLKQLFIAILSTSRFSSEFRHAGLILLSRLPPYQVERVLHIIKGRKVNGVFQAGLGESIPRSFKTEVTSYLRKREADDETFQSAVLHARESLCTLYCSLRIKPGINAQRDLFDNNPLEGSRLHALKLLSWTSDVEEQANLITEYRLPYRAAVSAIKWISPPVMVALIDVMTPQELINNLAALRKRGALDNEDIRAFIECKLEDAKTDKRVSALKTRTAIQAAGLDASMEKTLASVGDARIKTMGEIKRSTALFIDKSASMEEAITVGKQVASIIAPACVKELHVIAFDTLAYKIRANGNELSHWENAFKGITANGSTSCGVALEALMKEGKQVEQIIIVTDQQENCQPFLERAMIKYVKQHGAAPYVVIVNVGLASTYLEDSLKKIDVQVDTYTFDGDYYSLPSLLPLLAQGTRADLLYDILNYPMPTR